MTEHRDRWDLAACRVDSLRLIPRLLIITYYLFFVRAWFYVVDWFMTYDWSQVESEAVALALAGFPAVILGVLTKILSNITDNYFRTGRVSGNGE